MSHPEGLPRLFLDQSLGSVDTVETARNAREQWAEAEKADGMTPL